MKNNKKSASSAKRIQLSFSLAAVLSLLLGVLMIAAPGASRKLLCTLVGAGVAGYGLLNILPCLLSKGERAYTLDLLIGVCALAFGVFALINQTFLMDFLFTVLGVIVCVTSVIGIKRALNLRYFGFARWWVPMAASLLTLVLALCILFFPGFFGNMLMVATGVLLTIESVSSLVSIHYLSGYTARVTVTYGDGR